MLVRIKGDKIFTNNGVNYDGGSVIDITEDVFNKTPEIFSLIEKVPEIKIEHENIILNKENAIYKKPIKKVNKEE